MYNQGQDLGRFYQDLLLYARHLLVAGLHPEARHLAAVADTEWDALTRLASRTPAVHLHNLLSVLLQGEEELKRAPQPRLALEVLLLRVIHLEPVLPLAEWLARLDTLERRLEAGPHGGAGVRRGAAEPQPAPEVQTPSDAGCSAAPGPGGCRPRRAVAGLFAVCQGQGKRPPVRQAGPEPVDGAVGSLSEDRLEARLDLPTAPDTKPVCRNWPGAFSAPRPPWNSRWPRPETPKKSPASAPKPLDMQKLQQQALEIFGGEWLGPTPGKEEPE